MDQDRSELVKGIFLVPALHLVIWQLWALFSAVLDSQGPMFDFFGFLSITQFIYLMPVMVFYHRKREFETVKGISVSTMLTIFITGTCFSTTYGMSYNLMTAAIIMLLLASMTFYSFRR